MTYILCTWFTSNVVLVFVLCVILLAFDFWTVKNVTGRLLVGLRWESHVREDGTSEWIFESIPVREPRAAGGGLLSLGLRNCGRLLKEEPHPPPHAPRRAAQNRAEVGKSDSRVFWGALYVTPFVWVLLALIAVLKLNVEWLLVCVVAVSLSAANIIGYWKCQKDASAQVQGMIASGALSALARAPSALSWLPKFGAAASASAAAAPAPRSSATLPV